MNITELHVLQREERETRCALSVKRSKRNRSMLVLCVIVAVIGSFLYTVIKTKVEEWLEESRMNRLSLKRRQLTNDRPEPARISSLRATDNEVYEISSDDSNDCVIEEEVGADNQSAAVSPSTEQYDEETLLKFQKSTDSVKSDESDEYPVFPSTSGLNIKTSMFAWEQEDMNANTKGMVLSDSDSSNDSYSMTKWKRSKQGRKKLKTHDNESLAERESKEEAPAEVGIHYEQLISGIRVKIPVRPYSSQLAVMNKLIQGCVKKENCLLESPTGSGKTLALLCAVLAWHDKAIEQAQMERFSDSENTASRKNCMKGVGKQCSSDSEISEDMFDSEKEERFKIPKIYYCTRTHRQIEQVIRELNKTAYKHKKMTILSSREHTCIQDSTRNKTELCNELLDPVKGKRCPFYNEDNKRTLSSFSAVERRGLGPVWDIEDLVALGRRDELCPYFAARNLMEFADIIFCPYNYVIDPAIRESMQLNLKNQVIILDEAHNIEDTCRDVASVNFREDHLSVAARECEILAQQRPDNLETYNIVKVYLLKLIELLKTIGVDRILYESADSSSPYWTGAELLELFNMHGLGESAYSGFLLASKEAIADSAKAKEDRSFQRTVQPAISSGTQKILEHLMYTMQMITSEQYTNDYRACVTETIVKDFIFASDDTWYSARKYENRARTLKLLCMNPGVIFSSIAQTARCIILASGTLSPTASFQSELSTNFAHVLNTAHVIPKEQVYATCIPRGPNRIPLKATFETVSGWKFQDELGLVLLDICESVPHGVLCFFSSYHVMLKLEKRWRMNSTWEKLGNIKHVFKEPRDGGELAKTMHMYREVIQETSAGPIGNINGALLFAVFRGKVAEGIDFKDNEARSVVTVGIPYSSTKDPVVEMKMSYNDKNVQKGLLSGSNWYSIQAFRALNQGLGRCLRHINDWGAVLLVDERFLYSHNMKNLPKWVKTMWTEQNDYNLKKGLRDFVARQKARENKE